MSTLLDPSDIIPPAQTSIIPRPSPASAPLPVAVLDDADFIRGLISQLLSRSRLSQMDISRRMGVTTGNTVAQYVNGTVKHPSVEWLTRLCYACGGRLLVEFPSDE